MSASDNLSTKCSGFLLRSSFAILAARTRHLISVAPMAAFSVVSWLSNPSDIVLKDMRLLPSPVFRADECRRVKAVRQRYPQPKRRFGRGRVQEWPLFWIMRLIDDSSECNFLDKRKRRRKKWY